MSDTPVPQLEGESREAYVARVNSMVESEWAGGRRQALNSTVLGVGKQIVVWFFSHWLLLANLYYALLLLFAILGPYFYSLGWNGAGAATFASFGIICDQVPTHSYYPFGFQTCLCQRCLAMYTAMLLGGLYYAYERRKGHVYRPLPIPYFILLALPLVIDGVTQLYDLRQSTIALRTFTGGLFGFAAIATIYPWFDSVKQRLFRVMSVSIGNK